MRKKMIDKCLRQRMGLSSINNELASYNFKAIQETEYKYHGRAMIRTLQTEIELDEKYKTICILSKLVY